MSTHAERTTFTPAPDPGSAPLEGEASLARRVRSIACVALALPLLGSAANYAIGFIEPPAGDEFPGGAMWRLMRDSGLFLWVILGHGLTGTMLLVPRWRFAGALFQLPISLGIAAFNLTMFPPGIGAALVILTLNLVAVAHLERLRALLGKPSV